MAPGNPPDSLPAKHQKTLNFGEYIEDAGNEPFYSWTDLHEDVKALFNLTRTVQYTVRKEVTGKYCSAHMQKIGNGERAFHLHFSGESEEVRAATISITVGRN